MFRKRYFWFNFSCRKLLGWTPLVAIFCMLIVQSISEYLRYADQKQGFKSKVMDGLSNAFTQNCPRDPPDLKGPIQVPTQILDENVPIRYSEERILKTVPYIEEGGSWHPKYCQANFHVAIVIPFRNRNNQLPILLYHLHPILQRQFLDYRIFVVEQWGNSTFNKALMMNIAYNLIRHRYPKFDCFIFHDVDMIPEDDRNGYHCGRFPRHLSSAVNEFNYTLPYPQIAGGVLAMTSDQFLRVNGYSNMYWGWGAEDDDMYFRIKASGMLLVRPPLGIGRYTMLKHEKRMRWNESLRLLVRALARVNKDGIAQLHSIQYDILHVKSRLLYTHIMVNATRTNITNPASNSIDLLSVKSRISN